MTTTPELTFEQVDESKSRIEFLVPVAQEVIKIIAKYPTILGDMAKEERAKEYKDTVSEIMNLFVEKDISFTDRHFIFELVLQAYDSVKHQVMLSLDLGYNLALKKLFGKDMLDVKLSDIDNILKK